MESKGERSQGNFLVQFQPKSDVFPRSHPFLDLGYGTYQLFICSSDLKNASSCLLRELCLGFSGPKYKVVISSCVWSQN
eukprot:1888042-Ditylum_brightwellii.AAC.1